MGKRKKSMHILNTEGIREQLSAYDRQLSKCRAIEECSGIEMKTLGAAEEDGSQEVLDTIFLDAELLDDILGYYQAGLLKIKNNIKVMTRGKHSPQQATIYNNVDMEDDDDEDEDE